MSETLDKYDRTILNKLQQEDGISLNELSRAVNLSISQCSRRISRLKKTGYIFRQVTLLNPVTLGLNVAAFVTVTLKNHKEETTGLFEQSVTGMPQVVECHAITGEGDYLLKVVADKNQTLTRFIMKELLAIQCVDHVKTSLSLSSIKSTTTLPL